MYLTKEQECQSHCGEGSSPMLRVMNVCTVMDACADTGGETVIA